MWRAGLSEKAPGAAATTYGYDALGRVRTVNQNGVRTTTIGYDAIYGQPGTMATVGGDGTISKTKKTYYPPSDPAAGRLRTSSVVKTDDQTETLTTYSTWTVRGELRAQWGATYPVKYEYDAAGRLAKMWTYRTDPTGATPAASNPESWPVGNAANAGDETEWVYHPGTMALQQKKDAAGKGAAYTYNADGTLQTRTWARGVVATYTHNALGELTGISYSDGTPAVALARNADGRLASVADGAGVRGYQWRSDGRLDREALADGSGLLYGYDAAGRRTSYAWWDAAAAGYATWGGWSYDGATGRLSEVSTPEGRIEQSYEPATGAPSKWFFGPETSPNYSETYVRDGLGRVSSVTASAAGITGHDANAVRGYTYNEKGQRDKATDETPNVWNYGYNSRGEVKSGEKKADSTLFPGLKREYEYDTIGNRTRLKVGTLANNEWTPNERNQINSREVDGKQYVTGNAAPAPVVVSATVAADQPPNAPTVAVTRPMQNRPEYFVATIDTKNASAAKNIKIKVTEQVSGQTAHEWPGHLFVPASPELFSYDFDGNLTQDGRWEYTWDAENRLIKMQTRTGLVSAGPDPLPIERLTFGYDAFGRRVSKRVERLVSGNWQVQRQTKFAYDGWNLIVEWEAEPIDMGLARTHHWGLDLSGTLQGAGGVGGLVLTRQHRIISNELTTTSFFPAYDGNGNIVALYDSANGKRAAEYEYGPFGEPLRATGPMARANPFRFSTKYCDEETGLCYYGYRYYSPGMGRWLSKDPAWEEGGFNLYGMVNNDPITYVDILGLAPSYGCCDAKKRAEGAKKLNDSYKKAKDKDDAGKLINDDSGRSCEIVNGTVRAQLDISTCWECHLENRKFGNNIFKGIQHGFTTDHWVVICTSVDEKGKPAETLIFDATGGCTDKLKYFRTHWPTLVGTDPPVPTPPNPCPKNPAPMPTP